MAATSFGSATTQMVDGSRRGLAQMEQGPSPWVKFWHTGSSGWPAWPGDGLGKGLGLLRGQGEHVEGQPLGRLHADARSLAKCSTRFSRAGGKYSMGTSGN